MNDHPARPVIGITPSASDVTLDHGTFGRYALGRTYTDAVRLAGGLPVILPPGEPDVDMLLDHLDGVILSGGGDIDPCAYGDPVCHPKTYGVDTERDQFELDIVRAARDRDLPLLGICRGIQVFNVALGGTLVQDIEDQLDSTINHRQQTDGLGRDDTSHHVAIAPDTPLCDLLGVPSLAVNSFHHQAIRDPSPDLEVIARAADGLIEAVWYPAMRFCLAVQWHPEMLAAAHPPHLAIFGGLVAATARTRTVVTT